MCLYLAIICLLSNIAFLYLAAQSPQCDTCACKSPASSFFLEKVALRAVCTNPHLFWCTAACAHTRRVAPRVQSPLVVHCAASTDDEVVTRWEWTLGYMRAANDSVSVSHGTSERQMQLADSVHALNVHVFSTACKLVRQLCTASGGASHVLQAPVPPGKDWWKLRSECKLV